MSDERYYERFWRKVDRSGGPDACWPWLAAKDERGVGYFKFGTTIRAHRMAYLIAHGVLPKNVVGTCGNNSCCNPAHHVANARLGKLTKDDVQAIKYSNEDAKTIAAQYGISRNHVYDVRRTRYVA